MERHPILRSIFLTPDERRLRTPFRLAIHTLLFLLLMLLLGVGLVLLLPLLGLDFANLERLDSPLLYLGPLLAITGATWLTRRLIDRRSFRSLGLYLDRWALRDLLVGTAIPALLMAFIFIIELAAGWLTIEGNAWENTAGNGWVGALGASLLAFIVVGFQEELLSRGYHLQNLIDGTNLFWGLIISSGIFAVLHAANPSASLLSTLGIFAAGLFLAYGWMRTGTLWLSIGLHIGWNFFEGPVFGFPVSGTSGFHLIEHQVTGPVILTGGGFGPEGGLVLLPALLLGVGLIWLYTRRRPGRAID